MNYAGHKIFPTHTLNCLPASSHPPPPHPSPPSLQYSHSQNEIISLSPPTIHRSIYYSNADYNFPLPTALTFNGEDHTNYHHDNGAILYIINKNGSVMIIKFKVFGVWDTAYSRIYSAKSPASGAGNVDWCHMLGVCVKSCERRCQYYSAYIAAAIMWLGKGGPWVCETRSEGCPAKWRGLCGCNAATLRYRNVPSPWQHVAEYNSGYLSCKCSVGRDGFS